MKKYFYYLLLLLPLAMVAVSCDDDDDEMPNVGIQCAISGGVFYENATYVEQGTSLKIDALKLINHTDKDGALGAVSYYWDHYMIGTSVAQPYELVIDTADLPVGDHLLQARMPIYVVDYPMCWGYIEYKVVILAQGSELPGDGTPSTHTVTGIVKAKE